VAKTIAKICQDNWDWAGILPSVAIAQAFVESGLGVGPNLFGCIGDAGKGVEAATISYLHVMHNQYFKGRAAFITSPSKQIASILKGGLYCEGEYPGGSYNYNVLSSIARYNWDKFDKPILKKIREEKASKVRKQRQKGYFNVQYDESLPESVAIVDPGWIKKGSTIVYEGGIVEAVKTKKGLKNTIIRGSVPWRLYFHEKRFPDFVYDRQNKLVPERLENVRLKVIENAKG